jgi:hypothetical protein
MFYTQDAKTVIFQQDLLKNMLDALAVTSGGAPLIGEHVRLWQNNFTPTPLAALADFTEATFSGYAGVVTLPSSTVEMNVNQMGKVLRISFFAATASPFVANTVYGIYATNAGDTQWLWAARFAASMSVAGPLDAMYLNAIMAWPYINTAVVD